jgi:hypothetical protein
VFRSMLSPKAYRNELALLISHCEAQRQPLHLAETSFAYRLFRAELGAKYGQIASPNREVSAIRSTGTLETPRFILTFEPTARLTRHEFVVSITHSDSHGSIVLQSNLYGLP